MQTPISTGYEWCANCAFWGGNRTPNGILHRIECELTEKGPCAITPGWDSCPMNMTCNKFEWHPILDKK